MENKVSKDKNKQHILQQVTKILQTLTENYFGNENSVFIPNTVH